VSIKKQVRGVRVSMPTGYVIGRVSSGGGPAELIRIDQLGQSLVGSGTVAPASSVNTMLTLSLFAAGPFTAGQQFMIPPAPHTSGPAAFPDAANPDNITCQYVPTGNITFYLVDNLVAFTTLGAPHGVFATITFSAGQSIGAIAYTGDMIAPAEVLALVMPASADVGFAGFTLVIHGLIG